MSLSLPLVCLLTMTILSAPAMGQTNEQQPGTEQTTAAEAAHERRTTAVDDISDYGWFGIVGLLGLAGLIRRRSLVLPVRDVPSGTGSSSRRGES
jgi:MYXO-CTERM domain-containing protein